MFLVLVDSNGKRVDERCWYLAEDANAALAALEECGCDVHLAVISQQECIYGIGSNNGIVGRTYMRSVSKNIFRSD